MSGPFSITDFVRESNRIEGILREPTGGEISATANFAGLVNVYIDDMIGLVNVFAPGHRLREQKGLNVQIGGYVAPPGGPIIRQRLDDLLTTARNGSRSPGAAHRLHIDYENLHPFTDGNGRSGRALWLWMMGGRAPLGFLHQFYYQTLAAS